MTSREARLDPRLIESGRLVKFQFFEVDWALEPKTAFYDWLYINALYNEPRLADHVLQHRVFSDIAFYPQRSVNCQAYSAALYVALHECGLLTPELLWRNERYLEVTARWKMIVSPRGYVYFRDNSRHPKVWRMGRYHKFYHTEALGITLNPALAWVARVLDGAGEMNRTPDLLITNDRKPVFVTVDLRRYNLYKSTP